MKKIQPAAALPSFSVCTSCLNALVEAGLAGCISLGVALGLFHYLDYRPTHDVDAWWSDSATGEQRQAVVQTLKTALSAFGSTRVRSWGDVDSVELQQDGKTVFSFQVARRSARLEEPVSAGWIDVPLDSLADLMASKMAALVERGAPRDFLDVYTLCRDGFFSVTECWSLWRKRQRLAGSDADISRAFLAIETHLERIALHRPLKQIEDVQQRDQAKNVRDWFLNEFQQVNND